MSNCSITTVNSGLYILEMLVRQRILVILATPNTLISSYNMDKFSGGSVYNVATATYDAHMYSSTMIKQLGQVIIDF
jgi:hypothetical protein